MHELHAISSGEIHDIIEYEDWSRTDDLYYPKTEADEAIEELKKEKKYVIEQTTEVINGQEKLIAELRKKYELALATIKEYKNDIANLNEKLYEAEHET